MMRILAIDIGGTKSALAICKLDGEIDPRLEFIESFSSREYSSLEAMILRWRNLHPDQEFDAIGAGAAGPILNGSVHLTNLGWNINSHQIASSTGKPFKLCNDMEAHGWSIPSLPSSSLIVINKGQIRRGPKALIAAGTGLGESIIAFDGKNYCPQAGEGGHASFSPCNQRELRLLEFLMTKTGGHVSWERILGGSEGFRNLAEFISKDDSQPLPDSIKTGEHDWGAQIQAAATAGDNFATKVLNFYSELYGREAGNLALKIMATGGIYLGGGIAPKIETWLQSNFMKGFCDKGRFSVNLSQIPVYLITDNLTGLKGAALQFRH